MLQCGVTAWEFKCVATIFSIFIALQLHWLSPSLSSLWHFSLAEEQFALCSTIERFDDGKILIILRVNAVEVAEMRLCNANEFGALKM